jgi:DNA-binding response OmpR family regulator
MNSNSILLVEDDKNLCESLSKFLAGEGYAVTVAASLSEARLQKNLQPGLILLDWMLPDGQGVDLLREIRKVDTATPIILLTSRSDLVDKVLGLEMGANDYLTKPFEPRELVARIRVQQRNTSKVSSGSAEPPSLLQSSEVILNITTREVRFKEVAIELTKMEFDLLRVLMENPNRVFPREALLNKVWGYENYPTTRTVDNHIVQLRQKLNPDMFETVRGVGYRLREQKK